MDDNNTENNNNNVILEDLPVSSLGSKEHWDKVYERELGNFYECGDEGEIWFGKSCERKVLNWVMKNVSRETSIVEFGSGNGHLLISLAEKGFKNLHGVDYSLGAVLLASELAKVSGFPSIQFSQADILDPQSLIPQAIIIIDKGTFDAISLGKDEKLEATKCLRIKSISQQFKSSLQRILSKDLSSRFIITSCNWTFEELELLFAPEFMVCDKVPHETFAFGGQKGQAVTTIVFKLTNYY